MALRKREIQDGKKMQGINTKNLKKKKKKTRKVYATITMIYTNPINAKFEEWVILHIIKLYHRHFPCQESKNHPPNAKTYFSEKKKKKFNLMQLNLSTN